MYFIIRDNGVEIKIKKTYESYNVSEDMWLRKAEKEYLDHNIINRPMSKKKKILACIGHVKFESIHKIVGCSRTYVYDVYYLTK